MFSAAFLRSAGFSTDKLAIASPTKLSNVSGNAVCTFSPRKKFAMFVTAFERSKPVPKFNTFSVGISVYHLLFRMVRYSGIRSRIISLVAAVAPTPAMSPICRGNITSSTLADSRAAASPMIALTFRGVSASAKRAAV